MKKNSIRSLLSGEHFDPSFSLPHQPNIRTFMARWYFVQALYEVAPEVMEELSSEVRSVHDIDPKKITQRLELVLALEWPRLIDDFVKGTSPASLNKSFYKDIYALIFPYRQALLNWATKFNLQEGWLLALALRTLVAWQADAKITVRGMHDLPVIIDEFHVLSVDAGELDFVFRGWQFASEPAATYKKEALAELTKKLNEYISIKKAMLSENGIKSISEKRTLKHYDWLVRWQVQGWTASAIADKYHRDERTIYDGLSKTAEDVGLELVKHKPGRPSKQ